MEDDGVPVAIDQEYHDRLIDVWHNSWDEYVESLMAELGMTRTEALAYMIAIRINDVVRIWGDMQEKAKELHSSKMDSEKAYRDSLGERNKLYENDLEEQRQFRADAIKHLHRVDKVMDDMEEGDEWKEP